MPRSSWSLRPIESKLSWTAISLGGAVLARHALVCSSKYSPKASSPTPQPEFLAYLLKVSSFVTMKLTRCKVKAEPVPCSASLGMASWSTSEVHNSKSQRDTSKSLREAIVGMVMKVVSSYILRHVALNSRRQLLNRYKYTVKVHYGRPKSNTSQEPGSLCPLTRLDH